MATKYGIRIKPEEMMGKAGGWKRGVQFRRDPSKPSGWKYWRNEWPTYKAAELRLDRYRELGYVGHVFEIAEKVTYPNSTHYSPNFTRHEMNCRGPECRGKQPPAHIQKEIAELCRVGLEPLREELKKEGIHGLGILSGYRCPIHNHNVGGATKSMHMSGKAADPFVLPGQQAKFDRAISRVPAFVNGGRGRYALGGRHVDTGPKRTW